MVCAICGCKLHRVNGLLRHYGSFATCDRLAAANIELARCCACRFDGRGKAVRPVVECDYHARLRAGRRRQ